MSRKAHGQLRRSQIITTWGPGALIDLPRHSGIVAGLDSWGRVDGLDEIVDARLSRKLTKMTRVPLPRLYAPPREDSAPGAKPSGIGVWRFPNWFVVIEKDADDGRKVRSRRLVHRRALGTSNRFEGLPVVATRFVRACTKGHVDDLNWFLFAHRSVPGCAPTRQLWLDERGTSGDLADLVVRCECGSARSLVEATLEALGTCSGARPWLGQYSKEDCNLPSRLLIRTAANAYFPQVVSVLSLPDRGTSIEAVVNDLWDDLQIVDSAAELALLKKKPKIQAALARYAEEEILAAIRSLKGGKTEERSLKAVELDALLKAPEGYGDDVPPDLDFHARRLPSHAWRRSARSAGIAAVVQVHRLREVLALVGFTRFEPVTPGIDGEYESDVEVAALDAEPKWFPAVENRGEGIFVQLDSAAVADWQQRPAVGARLHQLAEGHKSWAARRKTKRDFPGGPYILLHTLSHLLIQSLAMRCGYPASSIRERIYAEYESKQFGVLLYTGSPDAEGTLGGLVQQARHIEEHLAEALRGAALCSNDPICAQHAPGESLEERPLHGAACHGCALVAETSCEARNDYLDRGLVVPILGGGDAAFFARVP